MTSMLNSLQSGLQYLAMINYPYPTEFLMPVPANPVQYACQQGYAAMPVGSHPGDENLLKGLKNVTDVYFNYKGGEYCYDFSNEDATGELDAAGWNVLACN